MHKIAIVVLLICVVLSGCGSPVESPDVCDVTPSGSCERECEMWECDESWECVETDACIPDPPVTGEACNVDACTGVTALDSDDSIFCDIDVSSQNVCGGCATLTTNIGDLCEECGVFACDGVDAMTCVLPEGGCPRCDDTLTGTNCDESCSVATWTCVDKEDVCDPSACFMTSTGEACEDADACISGNCSFGVCAPAGYSFVPAATFTMGAPLDEPGRHTQRENGQHDVTFTRSLYVKQTTVTQGEWTALMGDNPSYFVNCGDDCPVERINLYEMMRYANLLSESESLTACYDLQNCNEDQLNVGCSPTTRAGLKCSNGTFRCDELLIGPGLDCDGYRLPTESEWEYFARAGTTTAYLTPSGNFENPGIAEFDPEMDTIAWYIGNSAVDYETDFNCSEPETGLDCTFFPPEISYGTHPVGQKLPNNWGLFDMTGNVWERTWDIRIDYPTDAVTDPTGPLVETIEQSRAMRGAPFNIAVQYLRVAYRTGPPARSRNYNTGFRLVRSIVTD